MAIETRCDSEEYYELARRSPNSVTEPARESTGFLSFHRSKSPMRTIELDEDSFFLAFQLWSSFVEFSLGAYASVHQDVRASVYTYSAVSVNTSRGEYHQRAGWHNACFLGVVGRQKNQILDEVVNALVHQHNVPDEVVAQLLKDDSKKNQVCCKQSPDSIAFTTDPSWHVEDGCVWAPYEEGVWYTDPRWSPKKRRSTGTGQTQAG